jgi:hypothetical protein
MGRGKDEVMKATEGRVALAGIALAAAIVLVAGLRVDTSVFVFALGFVGRRSVCRWPSSERCWCCSPANERRDGEGGAVAAGRRRRNRPSWWFSRRTGWRNSNRRRRVGRGKRDCRLRQRGESSP